MSKKSLSEISRQYYMQASFIMSDVKDCFMIMNNTLDLNIEQQTVYNLQIEISKIFEGLNKERSINFKLDSQIGIQERINTDFQRLQQILVNLLNLSLKYTTQGDIKLSISYYDTRKETIELSVTHTQSFLPMNIIEQMRQSFSSFNNQYNLFSSGQDLQLLLCQGLIEQIGPAQSFFIKKDADGNVEIRQKSADNFYNFISFNQNNNQTFFINDLNKKSLTKIESSHSMGYKKNYNSSFTNSLMHKDSLRSCNMSESINMSDSIEINESMNVNRSMNINLSKCFDGLSIKAMKQSCYKYINTTSQMCQEFNENNEYQNQIDKGKYSKVKEQNNMFQSECLLTEEIGENINFQDSLKINKLTYKQNIKQKLNFNTLSQIGSTSDNSGVDFLGEYLSYSRILIVDDQEENIESLILLLTKNNTQIVIHQAQNSKIALQKIIEAENESYSQQNLDLNYNLIIINIDIKEPDIFSEIKQIKKFMKASQYMHNTQILPICNELTEEQIKQAENVGSLALIQLPVSLENLYQSLKQINKKINTLDQIQI